jgi:N-acetylmuramoyl-L-alanine amidase
LQKNLYNAWVRMKRLREMMVLGMALTGVAVAQARQATATYTYHGSTLRGYRSGDELYIPLESVTEIGWTASLSNAGVKLYAEGSTLNLPIRYFQTKPALPFRSAIQQLGGNTRWNPGGYDSLEVTSSIQSVTAKRGQVTLDSTLRVKPSVSYINGRVLIDIEGAELAKTAKIEVDGNSKVIQFRPDSVRIVMELNFPPNLPKDKLQEGQKFTLDFNQPVAQTDEVPNPRVPKTDQVKSPVELTLPLQVEGETATETQLSVRFPSGVWGGNASYRKPAADQLEVIMPGIQATLPENFRLQTSAIEKVELGYEGDSTVLKLNLRRGMGVELSGDASGISIRLVRPRGSSKLSSKVILLDAGHGGSDPGARLGGVQEKDVTLFLSKFVREALIREGATVITTRLGDTYPSLTARSELANKNNADVFISIHVNHPGSGKTTPSGTMTFYHGSSPVGRFLAESVHTEITNAKLLPSMGVKSDYSIYPGKGFAVLRLSKMPSVLIETGFISNPRDRQVIQTPEFGKVLADGIVKGLKIYFGDQ